MMRLRSVSDESPKHQPPNRQNLKSQPYQRRIVPLHQENSMLKDKLHKMKFEVEDNLQIVIDELDTDLQLKAKLINFQQLFHLIKEQINKDHEKIDSQQEQIEKLKNNLEYTIQQREQDQQFHQSIEKNLSEQLNKEKHLHLLDKGELDEQIKILRQSNYQQEQDLNNIKQDLKRELDTVQELQIKVDKSQQLEKELLIQEEHFKDQINKLNQQLDIDNKVFKNELELQQQRIEQKYKQMIQDNKILNEQLSEMKSNFNQIKQQKDSMEKTLDQKNQKMKEIKTEAIQDKQHISKEEKLKIDLQKELIFYKNKAQLEEKREIKLKEQLQQSEDQIQELLQVKSQYQNLRKVLQAEFNIQVEKINQEKELAIKSSQDQLIVQRIKYEKLLGIAVVSKEQEQFEMHDFEQQYDDQEHIQYVQDLEKLKNEQTQMIEQLKQKMIQLQIEWNKEKEDIYNQFEIEKEELNIKQKQELQRQLAEFESSKEKIQNEFNYRSQLMSQQFSYELDRQKQEQKQLQLIIDQSKLSSDEKTKLLEMSSEEIFKLKRKYDQDMNEEQKLKQQIKFDFEKIINQLKTDYQRFNEKTKLDIDTLNIQIKDLQQREQTQKKQINDLLIEQKQDMQSINQLESQASRKQAEIQKLNETIKGINTRIKSLQLEVENTKQMYNIFAPPHTQHSQYSQHIKKTDIEFPNTSQNQLKKIELEIPNTIDIMKRHSSSDLKFKIDPMDQKRLSARNKSSQGQRQYQIRQIMPQI